MADRYIDFDAARAERKKEPLTLRVYGVEYELPPAMPASLLLDIIRMQEDKDGADELGLTEAMTLLRQVLPAEVLEDVVAHDDFSLEDLTDLLKAVMQTYMGSASGEAPAPNRATRRHLAK